MKFLQGDIVTIDFPFKDMVGSKIRPCVVVSNSLVNKSNDLIVAAITSTERNDTFTFKLTKNILTHALHSEGCEVRCNTLFSVEKEKVLKKISSIKTDQTVALKTKIITFFN